MTIFRARPPAFAWIAGPLLLLAGCVSAPLSPPSPPVAAAASIATAASAPDLGTPKAMDDAAAQSVAVAASMPDEPVAAPVPVDPLRPGVRFDLDSRAARVDLWDRVRRGFAIPDLDNDLVRDRERWYATRPDYVARMTERGSRYLFHIVEELDKRGMPTELALLPFIESAYNPQAMSVARASGMWQFIPSTGRDFELKQNIFRDDRRDVLASTRAALDYLQKLYGMFGDWQLALAAYNWGEGSVQRAIAKNQRAGLPTNYESLRMPAETRLYVPKLQAVKNIVARPEDFNLRLPELFDHPYFLSVPIERDIDVAVAVKLAGMPLDEFQFLNPQMNRPVILAAGTPQVLLPYDNANRFVRELPQHRGPLATWTAWTAPKTMKTAEAAKAVGMSEERLREVNQIPARMLIKGGSTLLVPRGNALLADVSSQVADTATLALAPEAPPLRKTSLKAGRKDTVASVAKRYHVSPTQVAEWNQVGTGASFAPGQTIVVYTAARGGKTTAAQSTHTARKTVPGGPRSASGKPVTATRSASSGKATGVRQTPVAKR
ncbi:MAG: transglycosylase SLT domain-containing protein [Burkholderiales bacterium]|nr:transglycosylase SLT domain-containing protein [Burkholderiales bacterium]